MFFVLVVNYVNLDVVCLFLYWWLKDIYYFELLELWIELENFFFEIVKKNKEEGRWERGNGGLKKFS